MKKEGMGAGEKATAGFNLLRACGRPTQLFFAENPGVRYVQSPLDIAWSFGILTAVGVFGRSELVLCWFLPFALLVQVVHKLKPARGVPSYSMGACALDKFVGAGRGWWCVVAVTMGSGLALQSTDPAAALYLCLASVGVGSTVAVAKAKSRAMDLDMEDGLIESQGRVERMNRPFYRR